MACYINFSGKGQMMAKGCGLQFAVCALQFASHKLQIALLLHVVYFVIQIASMCWCPSIICPTPTKSLDRGFVIIVSESNLLAIETILSLLKSGIALGPAVMVFTALSTLKPSLALSLFPICYTSQASPGQIPSQSPCVLWSLLHFRSKPPILDNDNAVIYPCLTQPGTLYLFCGRSSQASYL